MAYLPTKIHVNPFPLSFLDIVSGYLAASSVAPYVANKSRSCLMTFSTIHWITNLEAWWHIVDDQDATIVELSPSLFLRFTTARLLIFGFFRLKTNTQYKCINFRSHSPIGVWLGTRATTDPDQENCRDLSWTQSHLSWTVVILTYYGLRSYRTFEELQSYSANKRLGVTKPLYDAITAEWKRRALLHRGLAQ